MLKLFQTSGSLERWAALGKMSQGKIERALDPTERKIISYKAPAEGRCLEFIKLKKGILSLSQGYRHLKKPAHEAKKASSISPRGRP